jgi:hypothetical protein
MDPARLLRYFVRQAIDQHPLPWRVDRDWTYELIDRDGELVVKCQTPEDAYGLIELAFQLNAESKTFAETLEKELDR